MDIIQTNKKIEIIISFRELWYLINLFGPGWVFGIENPYEELSEEEIIAFEKQASLDLEKAGIIKINKANQIEIDEMLGGMVYSCIHSKHLMVLKTPNGESERFYHFLPQWQLELFKSGDEYSLTLFKERSDLFSYISDAYGLNLKEKSKKMNFHISSRELEIAAFLFESGKEQKAEEIFKDNPGEMPSALDFLKGYVDPEFHLTFDMIYERDDDELIHSAKNELIQANGELYWVSHDEAGEELMEISIFSPMSAEETERRFNMMLPMDS